MSESQILRPFNCLRNIHSPREVLVISAEGCLDIPDDLMTFTESANGFNVHFAKGLPLPCGQDHPPIDLVVFVCKVFNQASLQTIKESMKYLDVRYLVGKCFILVCSDCQYFDAAATRDIVEFAKAFQLPVHYATKEKSPDDPNRKARLRLPSELLSIYCPPVGRDVNSLIIDAAINHLSVLEGQ